MAAGSVRGTVWQDGARRALEYAIAASLALHALALFWLPALPSQALRPAPAQPPLEAQLMPARPVEAPSPPAPARIEQQPAPRPNARPRTGPNKRRPVLERAFAPAPAPAPVAALPSQTQTPVLAAPAPPPTPAPAAPAVRAAPRPDAARLAAQYRAALMAEAARYKRYPRFARDNGWEGRVGVRMAIGADGAIASLGVAHGSGYAILDRQALDMVRSAQPQTAIPEGLRGRAFSVDIPVLFSLRDPES